MCKVQLVNTRIQFSTLEFAHVWRSDTSVKYNIIVCCIFLHIFTLHPSSCVFHIPINIFFLHWNNFIFLQEKRIEEERIKMQKDFEQEQEKSRRKEEEVKCSISI